MKPIHSILRGGVLLGALICGAGVGAGDAAAQQPPLPEPRYSYGDDKAGAAREPVDYVNPFIGTTNYGVTNPGALCPQGLVSVTPFNVMGSQENRRNKDDGWWSAPYEYRNAYMTGFSHVAMSGVGCPEAGSLLLMATTGDLNVDYTEYGSRYDNQYATPGYYSVDFTDYGIAAEATATERVGITRFTFPAGAGNIVLNLGEGLTNETGAYLHRVSDTEVEGMKLMGTFCSDFPQKVFPIYFVMRLSKAPRAAGYWKYQRPEYQKDGEWRPEEYKYKIYNEYDREIAGDDIGAWFTYDCAAGDAVEVQVAVSFVSIDNARENLTAEQPRFDFDGVRAEARGKWNHDLSRITVEGGTADQRTVFYTAMYHALIHPNILQDVNGEYPMMESGRTGVVEGNRWTVFSLWDTYRGVHQMFTLAFPDRQAEMVRTMIDMYREWGWMPKWELYGRESFTMEGDPASIVVADTWLRGVRDFDVKTAFEAMVKSAKTPGPENVLRPDNDDYLALGYVPLREEFDNSVSHALEYYVADWSIGQLAADLGRRDDAKWFDGRSKLYKRYYDKQYGTFRPILPDGRFLTPFDPAQGMNWEPSPGFHEGSAWNYTFAIPYDIPGLIKLMGGGRPFTEKLQSVFDNGYFDVTNEPDMAYPYFFGYVVGQEWRTQKIVRDLLDEHFTNAPWGLPGNDDAGALSVWAAFNMIGFFPDCPGRPDYTVVAPVFDKVTIKLDTEYYDSPEVVVRVVRPTPEARYIDEVSIDGRPLRGCRMTHSQLTGAREIVYTLK